MRSLTVLAAALALAATAPVAAQEHPIQLSLVPAVQLFPETDAIRGFRLSLYGKNTNVTGVDIGLVTHVTGDFVGWQAALVGYVEGDFEGWQDSFVNVVQGSFEGFQWGAVNIAASGRGFQLAAVNHSRNFRGLQLGLVNYSQRLDGVQVGLVNIIGEGGMFPIFPIVNWSSN